MSLHRFCCPESVPEGDRVRIAGAAAAQIRKVLRLSPGDRVVLFGADEWEYTVRLESVERDAALGAVISRSAPQAEPRCELTLAVALLKGEKTEWVLQKGTELGVGRFVLMQTRRTVAVPDERRAAGRQERYGRIVREATEQCGRVRPPCIEGVRSFSQVVAESSGHQGFLLHERATLRFSDQLAPGGWDSTLGPSRLARAGGLAGVRTPGPHAEGDSPSPEASPDRPEGTRTGSPHSGKRREPAADLRCGSAIPLAREGVQEAISEASRARLTLFVGPEGGFAEEEVALAAAHGIAAAALGSRVLRAETAALAAVTLAMDALDR